VRVFVPKIKFARGRIVAKRLATCRNGIRSSAVFLRKGKERASWMSPSSLPCRQVEKVNLSPEVIRQLEMSLERESVFYNREVNSLSLLLVYLDFSCNCGRAHLKNRLNQPNPDTKTEYHHIGKVPSRGKGSRIVLIQLSQS